MMNRIRVLFAGGCFLGMLACATSADVANPGNSLSADETFAYLKERLVGWSGVSGNERVENAALVLEGCTLTLTQKKVLANGTAHLFHRDYPLNLMNDFDWYPGLLPGAVQASGINRNAVIRFRWDSDKTPEYSNVDYLDELPNEYGERIVKALNHLKRTCVARPDIDPFK